MGYRLAVLNEESAAALVADVEAAWNAHDMTRFAASFATDADFVNVAGAWWRGREEIEQRHTASHAGRFKDSTMQMRLASFKEVGPGVGVAHVAWQLDGHAESGPRRTAETRRGIFSWTVRERGGGLEIVSSHNTDVLKPPPG